MLSVPQWRTSDRGASQIVAAGIRPRELSVTVYADEGAASEPRETKVRIEKRDVTVRDAMTMRLAPSGGQAVLFERT
ncbi:hypothetical protein GCM10011494_36630 [Novosphingobium endophyticum]|uniref:Glycosyl-hydrolase 97 C-terminal oligomerisation domain-containing protein n=1 Tax=Novosphingobium endophyticum TaxID=1955250 RepID=A0A916TVJ5_9SPHN|nr:hypothetical protein GCM10011494_36630 [Novosphingobium endophyticum]